MRFSFEVVGVTRSQVNPQLMTLQPIDPNNLATFSSTALNNLKAVLAAFDPVILGAEPEQTVFVYALEILLNMTNISNLPDISKYAAVALDFNTPFNLLPPGNLPPPAPPPPVTRVVLTETVTAIVVRLVEIPVVLPNMEILETSNNYARNGLGLGFRLKVADPAGGETKPCLPFPVWLPLPFVGKHVTWNPGEVTAGFSDPQAHVDVEDVVNFMGGKALPDPPTHPSESQLALCTDATGGQVRWYDLQPGNFSQLKQLGVGGTGSQGPYPVSPQGQLVLPLPQQGASRLAELRRAGRWLYNECDVWRDDYVHFYPPKDPGVAILWRDDLPSKPIVCMDLAEYLVDSFNELAARLWRPVVGNGDLEVKIPIPVGQMVHLGVERLEDAVNNELVKFIHNTVTNPNGPLTIKFFFQTNAYTDAENPRSEFNDMNIRLDPGLDPALRQCIGFQANPGLFSSLFEPGQKGVSDNKLSFGYLPAVIPEDATENPSDAFAVQLQVMIDGTLSLFGQTITFDHKVLLVGPRVVFVPEPVRLPTVAIFFTDSYFQGVPLVMLPANSGLFTPDIHLDANTSSNLNQVRNTIVNKLQEIYNLMSFVQMFWPNESFHIILKTLGTVINIGRMVVDTTGKIENLTDCPFEKHWYGDENLNDSISSVVLIGPPHKWSRTVIKCYQNSMRRSDLGLCLQLTLPGDLFIAAIPSFVRLMEKYTLDLSTINVPQNVTLELPYGNQPGGLPSVGIINFNDRVTGIEFVKD